MHRSVSWSLLFIVVISGKALARETSPGEVPASPMSAEVDDLPPNRWGVELDVVQPFIPTVGIIRPKVALTLWGTATGFRGDLILGVYIRPHVEHDVLETIDEYMGTVGYRQYFWRGFHVEVLFEAGVAWGKNKFDGQDYETPVFFMSGNAGYRLGFFELGGLAGDERSPVGFYVAPQIGVIGGVAGADIGPRNGKPDVFLQGNLIIGVSF